MTAQSRRWAPRVFNGTSVESEAAKVLAEERQDTAIDAADVAAVALIFEYCKAWPLFTPSADDCQRQARRLVFADDRINRA